jgi:hypothetical protein
MIVVNYICENRLIENFLKKIDTQPDSQQAQKKQKTKNKKNERRVEPVLTNLCENWNWPNLTNPKPLNQPQTLIPKP